jgi:hypothetical protein
MGHSSTFSFWISKTVSIVRRGWSRASSKTEREFFSCLLKRAATGGRWFQIQPSPLENQSKQRTVQDNTRPVTSFVKNCDCGLIGQFYFSALAIRPIGRPAARVKASFPVTKSTLSAFIHAEAWQFHGSNNL